MSTARINPFTDVVPQFGQQFVLDHVPPLHDQFTSGSIHFAGVMMLASITASCQKWPPAPPLSPSAAKKIAMQRKFCKSLMIVSHGPNGLGVYLPTGLNGISAWQQRPPRRFTTDVDVAQDHAHMRALRTIA